MKCMQPNVSLPVDFEGETGGIMVSRTEGKIWVCIDGQSVLRARRLATIDVNVADHPSTDLSPEDEQFLRNFYHLGPFKATSTYALQRVETIKSMGLITDTMCGGEPGYLAITSKGIDYYQQYLAD